MAGPGTFVLVPKGVTHSYVVGPGSGRILIFYAPADIERFWRAMNDAGATGPVPRDVRARLAADLVASDFDQVLGASGQPGAIRPRGAQAHRLVGTGRFPCADER